jgi:hypothetical protein
MDALRLSEADEWAYGGLRLQAAREHEALPGPELQRELRVLAQRPTA